MDTKILKSKLIKIFAAICVISALCVALIACNGDNEVKDERTFEESWMSYISGEALVSKTAIVGSHDAGTYGSDTSWETQHSTIEQQLYAGVRYFDFRASVHPQTGEYVFVHANSGMPYLVNACGQSVELSLKAIKAFVERNDQEVVIMDFQHTWPKNEDGLIELVKNTLDMNKVLTKDDCQDPSAITFGEMRNLGKNIIIIYKDTSSDICDKNSFLFERSEFLQSDYAGNEHGGDAERLKAQWQNYFEARKDGVFFVLQSQLTGSPLEGREALIRPVLDNYLKDTVVNDADKLANINIVMKDFVADDVADCSVTSKDAVHTILALNVDKGVVKAEKLEEYKSVCSYAK